MTRIDHVDQSWAQQVILFRRAFAMLHWRTQIARFLWRSYKTLQAEARKTAVFQCKINRIGVVQSELLNVLLCCSALVVEAHPPLSSSIGMLVAMKPTRGKSSPGCHSMLAMTRLSLPHDAA